MDKEELEKYKIRNYYMIPVEVVDNMFYLFSQQCKKQKEVIDKLEKKIKVIKQYDFDKFGRYELLDILKDVK